MKYAYWVVTCKTAGCGLIIAKYIGLHDGRPIYILPDEGPGWWEFECGTCNKLHTYTRDDLCATSLDFPPPSEFRAWW
jgi:hypothetical protein